MVLCFLVALGTVEPFPACTWLHMRRDKRSEGDPQHGDRMATWALRMCLLCGESARRSAAVYCGGRLSHNSPHVGLGRRVFVKVVGIGVAL